MPAGNSPDAGSSTQQITRRLTYIRNAQSRAQVALTKIEAAREVLRVQTVVLREALYAIERNTERAHELLDALETNAGLVDADGKRFDE